MNFKVIVVDDDTASASAIGKLLERLGCDVSTCTDARTALPLTLAGEVDLVSLDLTMPGLDGYQTYALIRSHEHSLRASSVPIIAITGRVSAEDRAASLADGFAAHLCKPVLVDALKGAIARALMLRADLHRARYTDDRESIEACVQHLCDSSTADGMRAAAGMALVIEQQGRSALLNGLQMAFVGNAHGAAIPVGDFAQIASALGAFSLSGHFETLGARLVDADADAIETAAVLARAELDRVIYTLREQIRY